MELMAKICYDKKRTKVCINIGILHMEIFSIILKRHRYLSMCIKVFLKIMTREIGKKAF